MRTAIERCIERCIAWTYREKGARSNRRDSRVSTLSHSFFLGFGSLSPWREDGLKMVTDASPLVRLEGCAWLLPAVSITHPIMHSIVH